MGSIKRPPFSRSSGEHKIKYVPVDSYSYMDDEGQTLERDDMASYCSAGVPSLCWLLVVTRWFRQYFLGGPIQIVKRHQFRNLSVVFFDFSFFQPRTVYN